MNRINTSSKLQKTIINLARNHNFEVAGYWNFALLNGATGSGSFVTENKYSASQSAKISKTNTAGEARHTQSLTLVKGKTYTLSGYIKTQGVTSTSSKGAAVGVIYKDATGSDKTVYSTYVSGTKDWGRQEVTFTLPSDSTSTSVTIMASIISESGTAYFDAMQLEEGNVSNRYNIVENSDFTYGTIVPEFWNKVNCDGYDLMTTTANPSIIDDSTMKITGNSTKGKYLRQIINMPGKKGDTFILSAWAKADSIPIRDGSDFSLQLNFYRIDGTFQMVFVRYNPFSNSWQYASGVAIADSDYTDVRVYGKYPNNANTAYFDGFQLYKEEFGESFAYDASGNLISTTDLAKQNSTFQYNSNNDLVKALDPKGNAFTYSYDANHNVLSGVSAENVKYAFTYDSYGNPLSSEIGDTGKTIKTTATYTQNGNYMSTMTDASGNSVDYNWNETKGILNGVTDPKDKVTSYGYDAITDQMTTVSKQVGADTVTNNYGYNNDRLETITHNGFSYTNTYDSLGNNISTKVGTTPLVTNSYESRTSKLLETLYGNGQKLQYGYDTLDRVNSIKYNNTTRYEYDFDASGNLAYTNDLINQVKTRYYYDLSDRLTKIVDDKGNSTEFSFDAESNNTATIDKINNQNYKTDYTYDKDSRPTSVMFDGDANKKVEYAYDVIGRLNSQNINLATNDFLTNYAYKDGQSGRTTAQLQEIDNNGSKINYQYDVSGNITTITENGKNISYEYDELNQLTRENNEVTGKTTMYVYDVGGNITSKTEYAYTTGTLGTPTATIPYSYGDSTWKDKLTSFNSKAITYDAIGNPTSYDGYTYTWEEGRNLTRITGNGLTATYKYNDSGIRTEKTVNGVTTTYHLVGDKVTFEKTGSDEIYYTYDSNDQLVGLKLGGIQYYYVRNGQGDIAGIIDGNGASVVTYSYDTWGKLISITGSLASTVGEKNPYRYRGYRYDTETGVYYLQSRYYNPEWSRFINADVIMGEEGELLSHNVFAYCQNNPVINKDDSGYWLDTALDVASLAYSVAKFVKNPTKANSKAIAIDVICMMIPGLTAVGVKALTKLGIVTKIANKLKMAQKSIGALQKASNAAFKAAKKISKFSISSKHLANAGGRWAKFATNSKSQVNRWVKKALQSKKAVFYPNSSKNGSYYIVTDLSSEIGTKGQTRIKVVFDSAGNIWTAMPVK